MAVEMHRHMDNMARQAFNYFIVTNGVLIAALATIINSNAFKEKNLFQLLATLEGDYLFEIPKAVMHDYVNRVLEGN